MGFLEHLEELRWHIIRAVLSIFLFAAVAFLFKEIIFDTVILAPKQEDFFTNRLLCRLGGLVNVRALCINTHDVELINIRMAGQFITHITISLIAGVIISFPYIFWEFWRFLKPALYDSERRYARGGVAVTTLLFLSGVLFGYFLISPLSIHFLSTYTVSAQVSNQIYLGSYIGTLSAITLASGILFELPVAIYFLSRIGVVTPASLRKYRRHSIVVLLILSAIITAPDIFSQVLVCLPLLVLYEVGIRISRRIERERERRDSTIARGESPSSENASM